MKLVPYPEYKDSGVPWLGRIPAHWDTRKTKYLFNERSQKGYPNETLLAATQTKGVVPKSMYETRTVTAQKDLHLLKLVEVGDFVISLRSFQGGIEQAYFRGIISPAYTVMIPRSEMERNYFKHLAKSKPFLGLLKTCVTGIREGQNIDYERLRKSMLPMPNGAEQTQIARFLDWKTAQINKFIRNKRRLIALMAEQRGVLAEHAIASAETQYLRLDRVVTLLAKPITKEPEKTYTPIGMFNRGRGIFHKPLTEGKHLGDSTFFRIEKGDLIFSGQFAWEGAVAVANAEDDGCIASHRYPIAKCMLDVVTPEYLYTFFLSKAGDLLLNHHSRGAAGRNRPLNPRSLLKEKIPVPPLHLQREVGDFFNEEQLVRREIEKEIALIREYRARLIADVVTGQVDVRGIEVPEVAEEELLALDEDSADADEVIDDELEVEVEE
ncbi:MAG: hypothetical protein PHC35_09730 [Deltaproteobacteria bacterium]|nr:hypothetical protein [Deltaproteobacteria bacterium]